MTSSKVVTCLPIAIPFLGALVGVLLRTKPQDLRSWLLLVSAITLAAVGWILATVPVQAGSALLLFLLPLIAFVTLLGQPVHERNTTPWLLTMLFLGMGLGALAMEPPLSLLFYLLLLGLVGLIVFRHRHQVGPDAWWGVATAALGVLAMLFALMNTPPRSTVALAIAGAVGLPLVPFHKTYISALTGSRGSLPAFLAVALPLVGGHSLITLLSQFPHLLTEAVTILALLAMLYGSLKALVQVQAASVAAYGSVVLHSILWWYLATTRTAAPSIVVYLSAVGVATCGLLLTWLMLRGRYGEIGLHALGGLARPMPRFAVVVSLLALAALGLPPFGVFSGFIGLLLAPSFVWSGGLVVVILAWLAGSWYFFALVQGLLFGGQRIHHRPEDLGEHEFASLVILLVVLILLGVLPAHMFDLGTSQPVRASLMESFAWKE